MLKVKLNKLYQQYHQVLEIRQHKTALKISLHTIINKTNKVIIIYTTTTRHCKIQKLVINYL